MNTIFGTVSVCCDTGGLVVLEEVFLQPPRRMELTLHNKDTPAVFRLPSPSTFPIMHAFQPFPDSAYTLAWSTEDVPFRLLLNGECRLDVTSTVHRLVLAGILGRKAWAGDGTCYFDIGMLHPDLCQAEYEKG
jgi:hypothetical protein